MAGIPNTKTEYFNHLHVGDVQKYNTANILLNAIRFADIDKNDSDLYGDILDLVNAGTTIDDLRDEVGDNLFADPELFATFALWEVVYPTFTDLIDKLNSGTVVDTDEYGTLSTPTTSIEKKKIWESLILHYIRNDNPYMVELIQQTLKILDIYKRLDDGDINTMEEVYELWDTVFVMLPAPVFPLPYTMVAPEIPPVGGDVEIDPAFALVESYNAARLNIVDTFDDQNEFSKQNKLSADEFASQATRGTNEDQEAKRASNDQIEYDLDTLYQQ